MKLSTSWRPPANSFLDPSISAWSVFAELIRERPGTVIGTYKLLQQIGEGGIVFMAEQQQPVRRKVALKIIKPGKVPTGPSSALSCRA